MNSSSTSHYNPYASVNKRLDTLVDSKAQFTMLSSSNDGWAHNLGNDSDRQSQSQTKMKYPRRNSLTFPLTPSKMMMRRGQGQQQKQESSSLEAEDQFTDLVQMRCQQKKGPAFTGPGELDKALTALNDDTQRTYATSATSISSKSAESVEDDEVLRVNEFSKGASAVSTPVPERKKALQIPADKRKQIGLLQVAGVEESSPSPTSIADTLDLSSLSLSEDKKKKKKKKSSKSSSLTQEDRDSSQKSSRKRSSKKSRKPRKKVHFKNTCTMRRTLSRNDFTPREIRRTWLSAEEYNRMQIRDEILADRIDAGKHKPGTCIRGLESKIEESAIKKLNLRMTGFEEVLVEQERQWDEAGDAVHFYYDFATFAYVYGPVSEEALKVAQETARQDRLEAEKILASSSLFKTKGVAGVLKRSRFTRRRSWA